MSGGLGLKNIWVPLSGAIAQQRKIDTIANNVANANTPGFKKDQLVFKEHLTAFQKGVQDTDLPRKEWKPEDFYRSYDAENGHVKIDGNYTIHEQGQLSPTKNPLDLAINGQGFFEVLTPNGVRFTRRGVFSLSNDGTLVTSSGNPVLMKATNEDTPVASRMIKVTGTPSINLQGEIFVRGQKVGDLSVVEFRDLHGLRKEGNALFINKHAENLERTPKQSMIHQGFVEESNVNAVQEMSSLIKAHRHLESIQKVISAYDTMSQKGVNEIAKF